MNRELLIVQGKPYIPLEVLNKRDSRIAEIEAELRAECETVKRLAHELSLALEAQSK